MRSQSKRCVWPTFSLRVYVCSDQDSINPVFCFLENCEIESEYCACVVSQKPQWRGADPSTGFVVNLRKSYKY